MDKKYGVIYDGEKKQGSIFIAESELWEASGKMLVIPKEIMPKPVLQIKADEKPAEAKKSYVYKVSEEERKHWWISWRHFWGGAFGGLVFLSIFGLLYLFWPVIYQEARYKLVMSNQTIAEDKKFPGFPQGSTWSPTNTTFSIIVPKIEANEQIIANVDPSSVGEYTEALKKGVAQAKGTCLPGMTCTMYLFAHSAGSAITAARYNAVFYLLNKLEMGDQVLIYYSGKKILYEVTGKEIVEATETKYLTDLGKEERLILQTCDPPGTTLNRLLVFAKPKLVEYLK